MIYLFKSWLQLGLREIKPICVFITVFDIFSSQITIITEFTNVECNFSIEPIEENIYIGYDTSILANELMLYTVSLKAIPQGGLGMKGASRLFGIITVVQ